MACEVADKLVYNGVATITLMNTDTVELESYNAGQKDEKTKLVIHLTKI